jgi:hypothetical protein
MLASITETQCQDIHKHVILFFRYTSIGSIHDTVPNTLLSISDTSGPKGSFKPAYMLVDGRLERAGRTKKSAQKMDKVSNSVATLDDGGMSVDAGTCTASIIVIGDEIL